ncbi:MAG: hypothetical protein M0014_04790 [Actinomycetota bacterium]|jgi:hypothetical protein|nr:hypothetical protein [Actinomycetota bacterium]
MTERCSSAQDSGATRRAQRDPAYLDACIAAAQDQGLAPVVLELAAAGLAVVLDQTGGMTMCAGV